MKNEETLTWDFLTRNLQEQVAAYGNLVDLLLTEKEILIKRDVPKLNQLAAQKESLSIEIMNLRENYIVIISQIIINEDPNTIKLDKVILLSPKTYQENLRMMAVVLKEHSVQLAQCIHTNRALLENSMKYVTYMMKKFAEISSDSQKVYSYRGRVECLGEQDCLMSIVA